MLEVIPVVVAPLVNNQHTVIHKPKVPEYIKILQLLIFKSSGMRVCVCMFVYAYVCLCVPLFVVLLRYLFWGCV